MWPSVCKEKNIEFRKYGDVFKIPDTQGNVSGSPDEMFSASWTQIRRTANKNMISENKTIMNARNQVMDKYRAQEKKIIP